MVDQDHGDLAPVARIDDPGRIDQAHSLAQGEAAARTHEGHVARRQRHRDPGGHQRPLSGLQCDVDSAAQVEARVARVLVPRQRQVGVESRDEDVHGRGHGFTSTL